MKLLLPVPFVLFAATPLAQSFTWIPGGAYLANDVTPDGEIVVGTIATPAENNAFYWRWRVDPTPTDIGGVQGYAISDDGSVIAGMAEHPVTGSSTAAIWTEASGWTVLDPPNGCTGHPTAYDLSGDGSTMVGLVFCPGPGYVGFVWTEATGMEELESLASGTNRATAISAAGDSIVGFAQGTFTRTPAFWDPETTTGSVLDPDVMGEYLGISDDGDVLLGTMNNGNPYFDAFYVSSATGFVYLGSLDPGWAGNARDISENHELIVGFDSLGLGKKAWIWREGTGIVDLRLHLEALGVQNVPELAEPNAVTPDGTVIVGETPFQGAWIIELPEPGDCGFREYGHGAAPANVLGLSASGDPGLGEPFSLVTSNTSAPFVVTIVSLAAADFPGLGGQILINPFTIVGAPIFSIPVAGVATTPLAVLSNPAFVGTEIFFQSLAEDLAQPDEWALSNGLELDICP